MKTQTAQEPAGGRIPYQDPFSILCQRHMGWVFSAANRLLPNDLKDLATAVTQAVFIRLERNARRLAGQPFLLHWLHDNTWCVANKATRAIGAPGRRMSGFAALIAPPLARKCDPLWQHVEPYVDDALLLTLLRPSDREAMLMRFFCRQPFVEIGEAFGFTAESTRNRVYDVVDRLRKSLDSFGATLETDALMELLWDNAVQAPPDGLEARIVMALDGG